MNRSQSSAFISTHPMIPSRSFSILQTCTYPTSLHYYTRSVLSLNRSFLIPMHSSSPSSNPSRYEEYYHLNEKDDADDDSIDVEVSENIPKDNGGRSQSTNPFFVGYDEQELSMLWNIHQHVTSEQEQNSVLNSDQDSKRIKSTRRNSSGGGGLHELVLNAIAKGESENNVKTQGTQEVVEKSDTSCPESEESD
uniref:Uncharacterized protein n=1 Tax=Timspurckia oligopyrenoides TaxID=708627 RepID=A0A7S0ZD86_9RHOD|mmetsp:Transcript_13302/g.23892  ORF Transcript_13302/g.23892 Transcript_13302/m.23892 type:complete len:194 (+) Transcript_13302:177-758(+)